MHNTGSTIKQTENFIQNLKNKRSSYKLTRLQWNQYFMILAKIAATRSTCLSRPVGGILVKDYQVLATGYNGAISGENHCIDENKCYRRAREADDGDKLKFCRANHVEANLIAQAARYGVNVKGCDLFITLYPCYTCYKLIATVGIKRVFYESTYESVNVDDTFNKDFIENGNVTFSKLTIHEDTLLYIMPQLLKPTSMRRLKSE